MAEHSGNQKQEKLTPQMFHAMGKSIRDVEACINLPQALYDLGFFSLNAGNLCDSIKYYAKAVKKTRDMETLLSGLAPLHQFIQQTDEGETKLILTKLLQTALSIFPQVLGMNGTSPAVNFSVGDWHYPEFERPVLIVSGGCGNLENQYEKDLETLREKLRYFNGTIVSGGTVFGVARIVGDLQEQGENINTIGYVPDTHSAPVRNLLDHRYSTIRATGGKDFSPLEHLTFWTEYLARGKSPRTVKLIGFNGGTISSCEYAISLMLGVRVGIIRNSGREADAALADPLWLEYLNNCREYQSETNNLFALDLGGDDIELFVKSPV